MTLGNRRSGLMDRWVDGLVGVHSNTATVAPTKRFMGALSTVRNELLGCNASLDIVGPWVPMARVMSHMYSS